jgi:hypothetical protein
MPLSAAATTPCSKGVPAVVVFEAFIPCVLVVFVVVIFLVASLVA